ncbi:MAG: hypothetical protein ABR583_00710 [Gaiellaceae bacterium]
MKGRQELALYLAAAVTYIALGVAFPDLLLSWFEGAAFLVAFVWLVPAVLRRFQRGGRG